MSTIPGTQGYAAEAPDLLERYERMGFAGAHFAVLDLIAPPPLDVLDIGAGTGRDAAWFARRGDRVTAIEPTREMRDGAMALHPEPNIEWIDDCLPNLMSMRGRTFDLVWMSAVWMHFDAKERSQMMTTVERLVRPGGALMISLRHGPIPEGRRMFDVGAEETAGLAHQFGFETVSAATFESTYAPGVTWDRLWFQKGLSAINRASKNKSPPDEPPSPSKA
ncbi:MAG: class I SAM-dependent methyltransferase [Hyphomonadaceae bacterium]|nr:class I SAM-dependent methyltransferase [Hyphomonadaceae bacterium]